MERAAYTVGGVRRPVAGLRPAGPYRAPETSSEAFRRARHRRRTARWALISGILFCVVAVAALGALGASAGGRSSSGSTEALLEIEAGSLPAPPRMPSSDLRGVWSAAVAQDASPRLATNGRTGTSGGRVSLTFDDGPDPVVTPLVLDALREHDLKATFFVLGQRVEENPDLLRRIVEEGHAVGNHTYSHPDMASLSPAGMRQELRATQAAVDRALGYHYPMALMRPPYGSPYYDGREALPAFREVVREQGLFVVVWTNDPQDYMFDGRSESVARRVARASRARGGERDEVVLLHDTKPQTVGALPEIIARYRSAGLRFAGVDDLLADKYAGS